jgi:hypothetical protein
MPHQKFSCNFRSDAGWIAEKKADAGCWHVLTCVGCEAACIYRY